VRKKIGAFGALVSGFKKLFSLKQPQVALSYEQTGLSYEGLGTTPWEPIYFELDTHQLEPGVNQLEVMVTDLISGKQTVKRAMFQIHKSPESRKLDNGYDSSRDRRRIRSRRQDW